MNEDKIKMEIFKGFNVLFNKLVFDFYDPLSVCFLIVFNLKCINLNTLEEYFFFSSLQSSLLVKENLTFLFFVHGLTQM